MLILYYVWDMYYVNINIIDNDFIYVEYILPNIKLFINYFILNNYWIIKIYNIFLKIYFLL